MEEYVDTLLLEAKMNRREISESIDTIYFGGGTPSLLPPVLLEKLAKGLQHLLPVSRITEWTVEANPGTLTRQWLDTAIACGMNRLSLGMQAAQDRMLISLGRIHRAADVADSVKTARSAGFVNLNLDLMFGLPGQSLSDWHETLEAALALNPVHISAYGLIPEEGTPLFHDLETGRLSLPDVEVEREMYEALIRRMEAANYGQYEISNFAKPGFACRHNIGYWTRIPYLGLGLSAASLLSSEKRADGMYCLRRTNTGSFQEYLSGIYSDSPKYSEQTEISPREARFETMMLGLRMTCGVSEAGFLSMHGVTLDSCYGTKLQSLEARGLVCHDSSAWRLTRLGMDLQNTVLVELMDDRT